MYKNKEDVLIHGNNINDSQEYYNINTFLFSPLKENKSIVNSFDQTAVSTENPPNNVEAKLALFKPSTDLFSKLTGDLLNRLKQGQGETRYSIGLSGPNEKSGLLVEELEFSRTTLKTLAEACNAELTHLRTIPGQEGYIEDYIVRKKVLPAEFLEVRVAVVGNVDAGKSTLLGVLTHGELDNGRGHSRQKLFRHKHEIESGRTSSVGNDILGFDSSGAVVNNSEMHNGHIDWKKICQNSAKIVTFIDLAGHEKYLKTTIFGMTGHYPDFVMLMVGANAGVIGMTKEHLGLALALQLPVFVVVTKVDMCPDNVQSQTIKLLVKVLKSPGCRKIPILVNTMDDVVKVSDFVSERACPIFQVSNVTGLNIDLLKTFLSLLTPSHFHPFKEHFSAEKPAELLIDDYYQVPGVGTVVSGTCLGGVINVGDDLLFGPFPTGNFNMVHVRSIQRKRMPVEKVIAGQSASMALKKVRKNDVRKGMVLISPSAQPHSCWEFEASVLILHHPTTIRPKYQAMIHCGSVRQTATLLEMSKDCLRTGDKATVRFRFTKHPEFVRVDQKLVFREGRTKAIGAVISVVKHVPLQQQNTSQAAINKLNASSKEGNSTDGRKFRKYFYNNSSSTNSNKPTTASPSSNEHT